MKSLTEIMKILRNIFSQKHNFFKKKKGKWKKEANMLPIPISPIIYKTEKKKREHCEQRTQLILPFLLPATNKPNIDFGNISKHCDAILIFKYYV